MQTSHIDYLPLIIYGYYVVFAEHWCLNLAGLKISGDNLIKKIINEESGVCIYSDLNFTCVDSTWYQVKIL